ncbi:hypothetical protein ACFLXH_06045, partial [Chloroflexota bacterium]
MSDSASQKDGIDQRKIQTDHYLWVVLIFVTGVAVTQGLIRMGLPSLYPFIQNELGLSRAQVGLITSFLATGSAIAV